MDLIEPDALYDERGDVSWSRPLLQGDVFDGVILPGFGDRPLKVQIVNHPCAMRKGEDLLARITVAPVRSHPLVKGQTGWDGNLKVMPLAELADGKHYATQFVDVTAAPSELLTLAQRIASLTDKGIYVLQQRLIKHYTRVDIGLDVLRRQSAPVLTEAMLQWEWIEQVLSEEDQTNELTIDAEARIFDRWLSDGEPPRRARLPEEINHTDIRRQARRAARERQAGLA